MRLGVLQCGYPPDLVRETHGDFAAMFTRLFAPHDVEIVTYNVVDMVFPEGITDCDAWLVSGSKHGAYEDHAFIPPLEEFIRDCHTEGRRMVGICFGHQIIAQALGGRVEKYAGGWSVGRRAYDFGTLGTLHLNAWHQDQVVALPQGAEVVASNPTCANAALLYGDTILTLQPHPEITNPVVSDYLRAFDGSPAYPPEVLDAARAQGGQPNDETTVGAMLAAFLRDGRGALDQRDPSAHL
ncbi:type 1 glutamine amidotransferase [Celeribacter sp.]|uniref:type 1 glutamine amidotransferase n=1 Tax=Celeribacter sp. TaxID=1890673 RepID=UPI003A8D3149